MLFWCAPLCHVGFLPQEFCILDIEYEGKMMSPQAIKKKLYL